jgi:hypothetical protein
MFVVKTTEVGYMSFDDFPFSAGVDVKLISGYASLFRANLGFCFGYFGSG